MTAQRTESTDEQRKYLLFHIGEEIYGTPLLDVREVIEPQPAKPIPNTFEYFTGVINIRGEIVGVLDLRVRFGYPAEYTKTTSLMVFNTRGGPMAAVVDRVEAVVQLPESAVECNPNVQTNIPQQYLIGIAKNGDRLVSLIDLNEILSVQEVASLQGVLT
jgi:purine-binding chemotaxis protein CheW